MATDLSVVLDDRPGGLARLGEATGLGGVNIEGMAAFTGEGSGMIHILVQDATKAKAAIERSGMAVADEREALVIDINNEPRIAGRAGAQSR